MKQIFDLNGKWQIRSTDDKFKLTGHVPTSVFYELEKAGHWAPHDVFYREHNRECAEIANRDFVFSKSFNLPNEIFEEKIQLFLECDGLDTLAEISINGQLLASTENMFRHYQFDAKHLLKPGENQIEILFRNTLAEIEKRQTKRKLWSVDIVRNGAAYLRKNHCSFGWDWGPEIPDIGIWQPIRIAAYQNARIADLHITQQHQNRTVLLNIEHEIERWTDQSLKIQINLTHPDGSSENHFTNVNAPTQIAIQNPRLWWPNGLGEQPLYQLELHLFADGKLLDATARTIGLRTLHIERTPDQWGESFQFNINGQAIFARGANYVPEDVYLNRADRAATERLIQDAVTANFNCIRVWGGGIYPNDDFFDLCDRYGLIVWQDFMFSCANYDVDNPAFVAEVQAEAEDVLRRIRHHACLGLLCGNNEMEWAFTDWPDFPKTERIRREHLELYEHILPEIVAKTCPEIDYWPASPSNGGGFDEPNSPDRGDVHFWEVWHGNQPFSAFRKHYFRFLSEYGFESFPALKTIEHFTEPEDRNPFSPVMEDHQRSPQGNTKIVTYIAENFRYPKDFASVVYVSQCSQAEALRYAIAHLRRNRGRCMGSTYWQFNDNWPVASWSSVDYFGRWKAAHYIVKRAYDPVLISCEEIETRASIHLSNESRDNIRGMVTWQLLSVEGAQLSADEKSITCPGFHSEKIFDLDFKKELAGTLKRARYLAYQFTSDDGKIERFGTTCFVRYKQMNLPQPEIEMTLFEKSGLPGIRLQSTHFAKFVFLDLENADVQFSDNFFDLIPGQTREIYIVKNSENLDFEMLKNQLQVTSLVDAF